jgi:large subunit ribosomal protein L21
LVQAPPIGSARFKRGRQAALLVLSVGSKPERRGRGEEPYFNSTAKKPAARPMRTEPGGTRERTMFAVIKTGGKQYKVAAEDKITVMTLPGEAGAKIVFGEVLALFDGAVSQVGAPHVEGASVVGEIVEQTRGPKVYAFKKRRRKNSKRKRGHRQDLTVVRVTEILTGGETRASAAPSE